MASSNDASRADLDSIFAQAGTGKCRPSRMMFLQHRLKVIVLA
jgi:hypothetical protein